MIEDEITRRLNHFHARLAARAQAAIEEPPPDRGAVHRPRTDAEFEALPPGSVYVDPDGGFFIK